MSDVFSITVEVPAGAYPSVNSLGRNGHRAGKKTAQYHELGRRVKAAAADEMERSGWEMATYDCKGWIVRYITDRRIMDASNIGKGEMDFLQGAGVVANDSLIRPITKDIQLDPIGPDRIVILLIRLYPRAQDVGKASSARAGQAGSNNVYAHNPLAHKLEPLHPSTKAPRGGDPRIDGRPATYGEVLRAAGLTQDQRKAHKP
jgi:hypothetical protein